ncbi:tumor necrosis factor-like [Arapaima gigas]
MTAVYNTTTEDLESGLAAPPQVLVVRESAKGSCRWKLCALLSLLGACAVAGALIFAWHMQVSRWATHSLEGNWAAEMYRSKPHELSRQLTVLLLAGDWNPQSKDSSVEWSVMEGHSFSQGDLKLVKNRIVIPASGLYFVYSQASFRVNCELLNKATDQPLTHLSHSVFRFSDSYGGEKPLLGTVHTACANMASDHDPSDRFFSTIYLGAVFQLEKGDWLRTETGHLEDLDFDGGKTFFGVFAL